MADKKTNEDSTDTCAKRSRAAIVSPLFIPLRKEYFSAFESGEKNVEYRRYGPRWNERVCVVGRPVILSCGYGKSRRLPGVITSFKKEAVLKSKGRADFSLIYGMMAGWVAEIGINTKLEEEFWDH